jgi:hypothetical protein
VLSLEARRHPTAIPKASPPCADRFSGSRACRPRPGFYCPPLPSSKNQCSSWRSFSLTAAGQPRSCTGFPSSFSQHRSINASSTYGGADWPVNRDVVVRRDFYPCSRFARGSCGVAGRAATSRRDLENQRRQICKLCASAAHLKPSGQAAAIRGSGSGVCTESRADARSTWYAAASDGLE